MIARDRRRRCERAARQRQRDVPGQAVLRHWRRASVSCCGRLQRRRRGLDLATANYNDNTASVLLGNGDGTFQAKQAFGTGGQPYSVAVGDFNGDGRSDLVSEDWSGNTTSVLLSNGNGTFSARNSHSPRVAPYVCRCGRL